MQILLDSGAFSAWKSGKPVNLDAYIAYIKANRDWIAHVVALDMISPGNPEEAARAGWDNWQYMRRQGVKDAIPVYHARESIDWLYRYLDAGADYIGIAGTSSSSTNEANDWYALVWEHLIDRDGLPIVKTHAFGEGGAAALAAYPWFSADSASWAYQAQKTARIAIPGSKRHVTQRKDGASLGGIADLSSLNDVDISELIDVFALHGLDLADLQDNDKSFLIRLYLASLSYLHMVDQINSRCPLHYWPNSFLPPQISNRPAVDIPELTFYFATAANPSTLPVLSQVPYDRILISFWYEYRPESAAFYRLANKDLLAAIASKPSFQAYYDRLKDCLHAAAD